jgi:hypothetical protein
MKRKANTDYESPVPKLQTRKGSSCEFFVFVADIKAPNNSNFGPISKRKKQFRNRKKRKKQASKNPRSIKDKMLKIRRPRRPLSANSVQQEEGGGEGVAMVARTKMH